MNLGTINQTGLAILFSLFAATGFASGGNHHSSISGSACEGFGPQTPRDISEHKGTNPQLFSLAPKASKMNLCNIHLHNNAEHKAKDFAIFAGDGEHGHGGGYQCKMSKSLSKAELKNQLNLFAKV